MIVEGSAAFGIGMGSLLGVYSTGFVNYSEILEPYLGRLYMGDVLVTGLLGGTIVGGILGHAANKISERRKRRKIKELEEISIEE